MTPDNDAPLVDPNTLTTLDDHWTGALAIYPNGDEVLWLLAPDDTGTSGCNCRDCAPHDQVPPTTIDEQIQQRINKRGRVQ